MGYKMSCEFNDLDLADLEVEEAVLRAATDAIQAATGLSRLPFFAVTDSDNGDLGEPRALCVTCEFAGTGADHWISDDEFCFEIPVSVINGIALRRESAIEAFASAFLTVYRSNAVAGTLDLCLVERDRMPGDFGLDEAPPSWLKDHWQEVRNRWPCDLEPWFIESIRGKPISDLVVQLSVTCRDGDFEERLQQAIRDDEDVNGDIVVISLDLSWREFEAYTSDVTVRRAMLERIAHGLRAEIAKRNFRYSAEANARLRQIEDDCDEEDPFITGELVEDEDGRVHFSSDLPR